MDLSFDSLKKCAIENNQLIEPALAIFAKVDNESQLSLFVEMLVIFIFDLLVDEGQPPKLLSFGRELTIGPVLGGGEEEITGH